MTGWVHSPLTTHHNGSLVMTDREEEITVCRVVVGILNTKKENIYYSCMHMHKLLKYPGVYYMHIHGGIVLSWAITKLSKTGATHQSNAGWSKPVTSSHVRLLIWLLWSIWDTS